LMEKPAVRKVTSPADDERLEKGTYTPVLH
jgi:hypothetical protein